MSQPFRHVTQSLVLAVLMSSCRPLYLGNGGYEGGSRVR